MTSVSTLFKNILNVNGIVIDDVTLDKSKSSTPIFNVAVHPSKGAACRCPICGKRCGRYDQLEPCTWRALDCGACKIFLHYKPCRICCPEHGVVRENIPWAIGKSRFTRDFDMTVTWMALHLPKTAIQSYMRIDWDTVGRCIERAKKEIDPDDKRRLQNLVNIGIDETSYRKGHKYITVVVNHDTGELVWCAEGYGTNVFGAFLDQLTPEQLAKIKVVTGDGAKWIDSQMHRLPNATRCVDKFHVVQWVNEALDSLRRELWQDCARGARAAKAAAEKAKKKLDKAIKDNADNRKEFQAAFDAAMAAFDKAKADAKNIKGARYPLCKNFVNLTENQRIQYEMIVVSHPLMGTAHTMKEQICVLLKTNDPKVFEAGIKEWICNASQSGIAQFQKLATKIEERTQQILNTITTGMGNALAESINSKIKLTIRKARGFRTVEALNSMLMLVCSKIRVPLPGREPCPA